MLRHLLHAAVIVVLLAFLAAEIDLPVLLTLSPLGMVMLAEKRLGLAELARREGVSPVTVWRWCTKGLSGQVLPSFCVGRKRYTTEEGFSRFVESVTAARNGETPKPRTPKQRERDQVKAEAELERELATT